MSINTDFTPPPFTESPTRATTPEGANAFQNQAKQLWDWMLDKFKVDETDTNTFSNFIKSANDTVVEVNTAHEAINATVGNREIKTSWNATDDFQNKIVKHNEVLWVCIKTASCIDSEPSDTNVDWIQLTFGTARTDEIGTVIWYDLTLMDGVIPYGYALCDGSVVSDVESPLNGKTLPLIEETAHIRNNNSTTGASNTDSFYTVSSTYAPSFGSSRSYKYTNLTALVRYK